MRQASRELTRHGWENCSCRAPWRGGANCDPQQPQQGRRVNTTPLCPCPSRPPTCVDLVSLEAPDQLPQQAVVHLLHLQRGWMYSGSRHAVSPAPPSLFCSAERACHPPTAPSALNTARITFSKWRGAAAAMAVEASRSVITNASWRSDFSSSSWRCSASPTCREEAERGREGGQQVSGVLWTAAHSTVPPMQGEVGGVQGGREAGECWLLDLRCLPPATSRQPPPTHLLQGLHEVFEVLHLATQALARCRVAPHAANGQGQEHVFNQQAAAGASRNTNSQYTGNTRATSDGKQAGGAHLSRMSQ